MINKKFIDDISEASIIVSKNGEFVKITTQFNRHITEINLTIDETNELIKELLFNSNQYAK